MSMRRCPKTWRTLRGTGERTLPDDWKSPGPPRLFTIDPEPTGSLLMPQPRYGISVPSRSSPGQRWLAGAFDPGRPREAGMRWIDRRGDLRLFGPSSSRWRPGRYRQDRLTPRRSGTTSARQAHPQDAQLVESACVHSQPSEAGHFPALVPRPKGPDGTRRVTRPQTPFLPRRPAPCGRSAKAWKGSMNTCLDGLTSTCRARCRPRLRGDKEAARRGDEPKSGTWRRIRSFESCPSSASIVMAKESLERRVAKMRDGSEFPSSASGECSATAGSEQAGRGFPR